LKLLRVLQEGELERVGGTQTIKVDVRIVSPTNQNLKKLIEQGKFREDLYYQLNVIPLHLPSLRERKEDIQEISLFFLKRVKKEFKERIRDKRFCLVDTFELFLTRECERTGRCN
jgi:transcriptional regulator with PAS, ATPase and Fis domain